MADIPNTMEERDPQIEAIMKDMGRMIGKTLPKGWGFCLTIFDFSEEPGGKSFYICNADRPSMIKYMLDLLEKMMRDHDLENPKTT